MHGCFEFEEANSLIESHGLWLPAVGSMLIATTDPH
jgi:hypothetical protein